MLRAFGLAMDFGMGTATKEHRDVVVRFVLWKLHTYDFKTISASNGVRLETPVPWLGRASSPWCSEVGRACALR